MKRTRHARGFSRVELITAVAAVLVLVLVVSATFVTPQRMTPERRAFDNAREIGISFFKYAADHADAFPHYQPDSLGSRAATIAWYPNGTTIATENPLDIEWAWPSQITSYSPWASSYESWISPGHGLTLPAPGNDWTRQMAALGIEGDDGAHPMSGTISWRYPAHFGAGVVGPNGAFVPAVRRFSEVAFPSRKVLLWDTHLAWLRERPERIDGHWNAPTPMLFVDGSASMRNPLDANPPGEPHPLRPDGTVIPIRDTRLGARGIDY
ncbi:MAG: hypothetical protein AAFR38_11205 [Planctomycetota bacterium]